MTNAVLKKVTDYDELQATFRQYGYENPDVTFIVDGQRLSAHRSVLCEKSDYFRTLLLGNFTESKQNEITLSCPLEIFKNVIFYLYTERLPELDFETCLETLSMGTEFLLPSLMVEITKQFKANHMNLDNISHILGAAHFYAAKELWHATLEFVDRVAGQFLQHESFNSLPTNILQEIIERDNFSTPEIDILKAVLSWHTQNPNEDLEPVLAKIRFTLISTTDLVNVVRPFNLFTPEKLLDIIAEKRNVQKRPLRFLTMPDINIATAEYNARCIIGNNPNALINDALFFTSGDQIGRIVVELGNIYVINYIKLLFWRGRICGSFYYIESSLDQKTWENVIDYRDYGCRSWQKLYFESRQVRFLRFAGVQYTRLKIAHLTAMQTSKIIKSVDGVCIPEEVLSTQERTIKVDRGLTNILNQNISFALNQPYYIGTIKIEFDNRYQTIYGYCIETSINKRNWVMIVDKRDGDGNAKPILKFPPRPVVFVRIICNDNYSYSNIEVCA